MARRPKDGWAITFHLEGGCPSRGYPPPGGSSPRRSTQPTHPYGENLPAIRPSHVARTSPGPAAATSLGQSSAAISHGITLGQEAAANGQLPEHAASSTRGQHHVRPAPCAVSSRHGQQQVPPAPCSASRPSAPRVTTSLSDHLHLLAHGHLHAGSRRHHRHGYPWSLT
ncbi:hypothetical protein Dimus_002884, partial [Dionaea muscipula]